jgi:hypothetical protein
MPPFYHTLGIRKGFPLLQFLWHLGSVELVVNSYRFFTMKAASGVEDVASRAFFQWKSSLGSLRGLT